jgi:hypothetical protein
MSNKQIILLVGAIILAFVALVVTVYNLHIFNIANVVNGN